MLLIKPFLGCNLACKYCYERDIRKELKPKVDYNLEAILKRMEEFKDLEMALHGGEPLSMPKKDVARIFEKMVELTGKSSIQTNGTLIDDEYIEIFKKYKTSVGISYDGPATLSEFRGGTAYWNKKVKNLEKVIERLVKEGINTSIIMVISKSNAGTDEKLEQLKDYLLRLNGMRVSGRLNPCSGAAEYELDEKRLVKAYLNLAEFCLIHHLRWSPFIDVLWGLQGKPRVCTFVGCDPFSTPSATVVVKDGSLTNCMRTNQKYILLRHPAKYDTRDEILSETPQEFGGCQGCKYWSACHGGCPSSAIDGDWRNRTYQCSLWKELFRYFENILSFTEYPSIPPEVKGEGCSPQNKKEEHGDVSHGDIPHGDIPHGDAHGDSPHGDSG